MSDHAQSKGGGVPVVHVKRVKAPRGGTKTIGVPRYVLAVKNPPDK